MDYAYFHAQAYVAFVDALPESLRTRVLGDAYASVGFGAQPSLYIPSEASSESLHAAAVKLADALVKCNPRSICVIPTPAIAGCPYNATIGPLRMVVQYNIQTDTMRAALCLYVSRE